MSAKEIRGQKKGRKIESKALKNKQMRLCDFFCREFALMRLYTCF
jgi:hypothetical protein